MKTRGKQEVPEEPPTAGTITVPCTPTYIYARLTKDCTTEVQASLGLMQRDLTTKWNVT